MKLLPFALTFVTLAVSAFAAEVAKITPKEADELLHANKAVLIDVREADEWVATGVAAPAVLLAKSDFDGPQKDWKPALEKAGGKTLILYCHSGRRAGIIGAALKEKGYTVANLGGFKDWEIAGLPIRLVAAPDEKK